MGCVGQTMGRNLEKFCILVVHKTIIIWKKIIEEKLMRIEFETVDLRHLQNIFQEPFLLPTNVIKSNKKNQPLTEYRVLQKQ